MELCPLCNSKNMTRYIGYHEFQYGKVQPVTLHCRVPKHKCGSCGASFLGPAAEAEMEKTIAAFVGKLASIGPVGVAAKLQGMVGAVARAIHANDAGARMADNEKFDELSDTEQMIWHVRAQGALNYLIPVVQELLDARKRD